jgi:organic hydroperoxide reductase OsmC/OhrA
MGAADYLAGKTALAWPYLRGLAIADSEAAAERLYYLAECARAGVHVIAYEDTAQGAMTVRDGKLRFRDVLLRPRVTIAAGANADKALALHEPAHADCYIANSVNFPVRHEPTIVIAG